MKVYIDLLFLFNWWIDFVLLTLVKITLKRITSIRRIILASFFGAFTTFFIFLNINYIVLFFLKIIGSFLIVIIAFKYNNYRCLLKNAFYLFMCGVILGGISYFLKNKIINNTIYFMSVLLITPITILIINKHNSYLKNKFNLLYEVIISFDNKIIKTIGLLDSGNMIIDPITKKPVVLINKKIVKGLTKIRSPMYVPVKTINNSSLIVCYKPDYISINNKKYRNYLVGVLEHNIFKDGIDCLLNNRLLEDLWLKNY